jgi:DNA-binding protein HU-beta
MSLPREFTASDSIVHDRRKVREGLTCPSRAVEFQSSGMNLHTCAARRGWGSDAPIRVSSFCSRATSDRIIHSSTSQPNAERIMNKGQLIEAVASELGESKAGAARAVDAVINSITNGIKRDDAVTIVGFGSFLKKQRKARVGRNPLTGEAMAIKASRTVGFKASPTLKSDV